MNFIKSIIEMNKIFDSGDAVKDLMFFIEFCSAILLIITVIFVALREKNKTRKHFFLYGAVIDVVITIFSDIISSYIRYPVSFGYYSVRISNFILFASDFLVTWFLFNYIYELYKEKGTAPNKIWLYINNIITSVAIITVIINTFTGILFYFDNDNNYYRGSFFIITAIIPGIALSLFAAMLLKHRKTLSHSEYMVIAAYIALPIAAVIIQLFISGFSWLQLALTFSSIMILSEHLINRVQGTSIYNTEISGEGKQFQRKMIILVCLGIVIFFGFSSRVAISFASSQMSQESIEHYNVLSKKISKEIFSWVDKDAQILKDQKEFLELTDDYNSEYLSNYLGHVMNNFSNEDNASIYDIYFIRSNNEYLSGNKYQPEEEIDYTKKSYYINAVNMDSIYISTPYLNNINNKYIVTFAISINDRKGNIIGVLALDILTEELLKAVTNEELPENSYVFVVDNIMGVDTHINEDYGYYRNKPQRLGLLSDEYEKLEKHIRNKQYLDDVIELTDYDYVKRHFFVSKLDTCDWYIVVTIDSSVVNSTQKQLSESIFLSLIICLIIGIVFTLWGSNSIVKQLSSAREEAYAANEAKSRFLANMSHEIRTPINAVLGMDEIILMECEDEKIREYASNIQSAGQALLGLVNDILDFSKIESGKLEIVPADYDTADLIKSCINLIKIKAEQKGLDFKINQDKYIPKKLYGDETRIRQIISNLLSNAMKYTHEGSITLSVSWKNNNLIVSVKDTGIGIKEENLPDLFSSFKRIEEKRNRTIEGTGLGLSITKQLAELMGGSIQVSSVYGKGSTFTVNLPQTIVDNKNADAFDKKIETNVSNKNDSFTVTGVEALVVDDVLMNLMVMEGLLKQIGVTVDMCESGMEAIEKICNKKYDIIFLDHMMPEMDGRETFKLLKEQHPEKLLDTPVVMLTANAVIGAEEEYLKDGFSAYLSKPIIVNDLYGCIRNYVDASKISINN